MDEIILPSTRATAKLYTDVELTLDDQERYAMAKGLAAQRDRIGQLKKALKEATKDAKEEINAAEAQFEHDVRCVNTGRRVVPRALCEAVWVPEKNEVRYTYDGKVVLKREPCKDDEALFAASMFPDYEPPKEV
jgi:hypothetical protein